MYKIWLFALLITLLSCESSPPQSAGQTTEPVRTVQDNVLRSDTLPAIAIQVDDAFTYVGKFDFEIIATSEEYPEDLRGKPVAAGERHVFVAADTKQAVERLFIVQLEGFLPENDFIYRYNFDQAERIGDNKYRHNTWFYDSAQLARENPQNEGAKTRTFLQSKGYQMEDHVMMSRYVGLASDDRKHEILIYYIEPLQQVTGYNLSEYENEIPREKAEAIREDLIERGRLSFEIISG